MIFTAVTEAAGKTSAVTGSGLLSRTRIGSRSAAMISNWGSAEIVKAVAGG